MTGNSELVSVRRKRDGLFLVGGDKWAENPKFVRRSLALTIVVCDLGHDAGDYEFLTREQISA